MSAQSESIQKGFNNATAYQHSFGNMADQTCYYNVLKGINARDEGLKDAFERGMKAVQAKALGSTTGGAGTAGYALVPVYVDSRIVDQSRKFTPLVELLPRVTNQGLTADYNIITAKGGAYTAAEDAALPETDDTYDRQSKAIKFLYAVGRVTGPSIAATPSYMLAGFEPSGSGLGNQGFSDAGAPNSLQVEVLVKARSLKEKEEDLILNGNSSSDATQFDGLITQQSTTNQNDLSGAALTWDDIEDTVETAFVDGGRPNLAVGSPAAVTAVRKVLYDTFRNLPTENVLGAAVPPFVMIQTMVGTMPLIPSQYITNTASNRQLWFFDTNVIEVRVLQDMTYEQLAKTNDSVKFMLKEYLCVINRAPQFSAYIDNIA